MATGNVFEDHGLPSIDAQKEFWARWNEKWRFRDGLDDFMQRQSHIAVAWAARVGLEVRKFILPDARWVAVKVERSADRGAAAGSAEARLRGRIGGVPGAYR